MVRASTRWQKGGDKLEKEIDPFLVQEDAVTERKNKTFRGISEHSYLLYCPFKKVL